MALNNDWRGEKTTFTLLKKKTIKLSVAITNSVLNEKKKHEKTGAEKTRTSIKTQKIWCHGGVSSIC